MAKFLQANLQHSRAATAALQKTMRADQIDLALLQEPYMVKGKVQGVDHREWEILVSGPNARTCISFRKNLNIMPLLELCSRDLSVAVWKTKDNDGKDVEVIIASLYLPYEEPVPGAEMTKLGQYIDSKKMEAVIGMDSNAHHPIWGCEKANRRGELLISYLSTTRLDLLNLGNEPTFVTSRARTIIDLTLSTATIKSKIKNWRVTGETSLSDHRHIQFQVDLSNPRPKPYRDPKKTNWDSYRVDLETRLKGYSCRPKTAEELEVAVDWIQQSILLAYHKNCPLKERRSPRQVAWWNKELDVLKGNTRKLFNRAKTYGEWDKYRESLTVYSKAIRLAKRQSWEKFCGEIENLPDRAKLTRILKKDESSRVSALKLPTGEYTTNEQGALEHLLSVHFPGSVVIQGDDDVDTEINNVRRANGISHQIFALQKIKWAIGTFQSFKTAGPDGIFPKLLQEGIEVLGQPLKNIFEASHDLGYIPRAWREVQVVFIPKPGKPSYADAKAHRPISLTSFFLKTMEKLILQHIREGALKECPLHKLQWAYQPGKSGEAALHNLTTKIEKALMYKEIALGAFLDIEGAFDNTSRESIKRAALEHGIDETTCRWIDQMLKSRAIRSTLNEITLRIKATKGCPQGGVLSPTLWCLVVDSLLKALNNIGIYTQGFADDIVIIVLGLCLKTVIEVMQKALQIVEQWCRAEELKVNPLKTTIVTFTNRRINDDETKLRLFGVEIIPKKEVKYLGVILDKRLLFKSHVEKITIKASKLLWATKRVVGQKWGITPKVAHWLYVTVIRPILTYASPIWWQITKAATNRSLLQSVQRQALLTITGAMSSTPTSAMEAILGLAPLDLVIKAEARSGIHRLQINKYWSPNSYKKGHTVFQGDLPDGLILNMSTDVLAPETIFTNETELEIPDKGTYKPSRRGIEWYTDASKTSEGTGAAVYGQRPREMQKFSLGKHTTVFQAEVYAIKKCVEANIARGYIGKPIKILTDSQAAIKALINPKTTSRLVKSCKLKINHLALGNQLTITWVPGHEGIEGNEIADRLAKEATKEPLTNHTDPVGVNITTCKQEIRDWLNLEAEKRWRYSPGLSHTKTFLQRPSEAKSKEILGLDRDQVKTTVEALTGHCSLKKHQYRMGIVSHPDCRKCGAAEETPLHILCKCDALTLIRIRFYGEPFIEPELIMKKPLSNIHSFLQAARLL